jgi:hypothetical protein
MYRVLPDGPRETKPLAFTVAFALVFALALPAAARAADPQSCRGKVKQIKPTADRDTGAGYEFSCRAPISGFSLVSTSPIEAFDVSADVFDAPAQGSALRGDDRFGECEGDIPSYGFRCNGTYGAAGRVVRASFDGVASPCARNASRHVIAHYSLIVVNTNGKIAGPYDLGRTKSCPKPKKAKRHKKRASRSHART